MARPERFELPTYSSGGCRSIQLSYGRANVSVHPDADGGKTTKCDRNGGIVALDERFTNDCDRLRCARDRVHLRRRRRAPLSVALR